MANDCRVMLVLLRCRTVKDELPLRVGAATAQGRGASIEMGLTP